MISAIIGAIFFFCISIVNILVIVGLPLGEFTMGGKYKVLPPKMRAMGVLSLVLQVIAIVAILQTGNVIHTIFTYQLSKGICIFFAIYLLFNACINFISFSKKEKYVMTPLSLATSACFWITIIG